MQKYLTVLRLSWSDGLAYPLSVVLWRFRQLLTSFMSLSLWTVIFAQQSQVGGYNRDQMISYVFVVTVLQGAILASSLHGLAGDIWSGNLSNLLLKPVALFRYYATKEVADKAKNLFFIVFELLLLGLIYRPQLITPSLLIIVLFVWWVIMGIILHFFIELLFGALGFWSNEVWGPKFIFFMLIEATVGKLFPLDLMPNWLQRVLSLTPLPFLSYSQTQLFLGRLGKAEIISTSLVMVGWCVILYLLTRYVWQKGILKYAAAGS